jgi:hypothetical protein
MLNTIVNHSNSFDLERNIIINPYDLLKFYTLTSYKNTDRNNIYTYVKCFVSNVQMEKPSRGRNCGHLECCEHNIYLMYVVLKEYYVIYKGNA